jgi:hypothetical protein
METRPAERLEPGMPLLDFILWSVPVDPADKGAVSRLYESLVDGENPVPRPR